MNHEESSDYGSRMDAIMESRYNAADGDILTEDDDDNDETFGGEMLDTEFDFTASNAFFADPPQVQIQPAIVKQEQRSNNQQNRDPFNRPSIQQQFVQQFTPNLQDKYLQHKLANPGKNSLFNDTSNSQYSYQQTQQKTFHEPISVEALEASMRQSRLNDQMQQGFPPNPQQNFQGFPQQQQQQQQGFQLNQQQFPPQNYPQSMPQGYPLPLTMQQRGNFQQNFGQNFQQQQPQPSVQNNQQQNVQQFHQPPPDLQKNQQQLYQNQTHEQNIHQNNQVPQQTTQQITNPQFQQSYPPLQHETKLATEKSGTKILSLEEVEEELTKKRQHQFQKDVEIEVLNQHRASDPTTTKTSPQTTSPQRKQNDDEEEEEVDRPKQFAKGTKVELGFKTYRDQKGFNSKNSTFGNQKFQQKRNQQPLPPGAIMNQYEKELIAKIQITQLVSVDPYVDDFYYKVYRDIVNSNTLPGEEGDLKAKGGKNALQNQMQRLIEGRKKQPKVKGTSLFLEGALGKIALTSTKTPKQAIAIPTTSANTAAAAAALELLKQPAATATLDEADEKTPALKPKRKKNKKKEVTDEVGSISKKDAVSGISRGKVLMSIEKVYTAILNLEHLKRKLSKTDGRENVEESDEEEREKWNVEYQKNLENLIVNLQINENIPFDCPHPLTHFIHFSKGKRIIPRLTCFLSQPQLHTLLSTLLSRFSSLDVAHIPLGLTNDQVELFMQTVISPFVGVISEVGLDVCNDFMKILLNNNSVGGLGGGVFLGKSRVGLAVLTMVLSRAEILRQGFGGGVIQQQNDVRVWTDLYNYLFSSLQTHFLELFPSFSKILKTNPGINPTLVSQGVDQDEVYVWQFLAALAVGATSLEHQRVLVTEVRDKVVECSKLEGNAMALGNVNLFLSALGLNISASQLASSLE